MLHLINWQCRVRPAVRMCFILSTFHWAMALRVLCIVFHCSCSAGNKKCDTPSLRIPVGPQPSGLLWVTTCPGLQGATSCISTSHHARALKQGCFRSESNGGPQEKATWISTQSFASSNKSAQNNTVVSMSIPFLQSLLSTLDPMITSNSFIPC